MYRQCTHVQTMYSCADNVLMYRQCTHVQTMYSCTDNVLMYRQCTHVQTMYSCTDNVLMCRQCTHVQTMYSCTYFPVLIPLPDDGSEPEEFVREMMKVAEGEKKDIGPSTDDTTFERKSKEQLKLYKFVCCVRVCCGWGSLTPPPRHTGYLMRVVSWRSPMLELIL